MSTIKVSTVSNLAGTNSTSADNVISGSAKAWVNFNGTGTVAIRQAYNVSSITDLGTGSYRINFTNAFVDTSYCPATGAQAVVGVRTSVFSIGTYTTTTCAIYAVTVNDVLQDEAEITAAFFR